MKQPTYSAPEERAIAEGEDEAIAARKENWKSRIVRNAQFKSERGDHKNDALGEVSKQGAAGGRTEDDECSIW